jgi:hypothetical protein
MAHGLRKRSGHLLPLHSAHDAAAAVCNATPAGGFCAAALPAGFAAAQLPAGLITFTTLHANERVCRAQVLQALGHTLLCLHQATSSKGLPLEPSQGARGTRTHVQRSDPAIACKHKTQREVRTSVPLRLFQPAILFLKGKHDAKQDAVCVFKLCKTRRAFVPLPASAR